MVVIHQFERNLLNVSQDIKALDYFGAITTGKFSPEHYREIHEYDKDSYGRKLLKRWSTPDRLIAGLVQISALAFAVGVLSVLALILLRRLFARKKA